MHVLLVEDDDLLASELKAGLERRHCVVDRVSGAQGARHALENYVCDVAIIDLRLPADNGLSLLVDWRAQGYDIPVLILNAKASVQERVVGLEAGADDYVLKPCDLDELVARLHALVRRSCGRSVPAIHHGDLCLKPSTGEVWLGAELVVLSRRELALLGKLLNARGAVLSEDQLKDGLYGMSANVASNALNVHIYHLRRKLYKRVVVTVRGLGYRLGSPVRTAAGQIAR